MLKKSLSKGELTQKRIIEAATQLIGKQGFHLTSLAQIAKLSKTQQPAVNRYFGNMEGLLRACVSKLINEMRDAIEVESSVVLSTVELLDHQFKRNLEFAISKRNEGKVIIFFYTLASYTKEMKQEYEEVIARIRLRYLNIVMQGIRSKEFTPFGDPQLVAQMIHEYTVGVLVGLLAVPFSKNQIQDANLNWKNFRSAVLMLDRNKRKI